jgi:hypothetical protein
VGTKLVRSVYMILAIYAVSEAYFINPLKPGFHIDVQKFILYLTENTATSIWKQTG